MKSITQMLNLEEWQEFLQMKRKEVHSSLRIQDAEGKTVETSNTYFQNYELLGHILN